MANPFTQVSIAGYNASPPPDDGSQVASNQVKWSTGKTKLTDPLKTAIESLNTNVNAAFATVDDASNLTTGTLPDGRFPATLPAVSGANLTNLNPAAITGLTASAAELNILDGATLSTAELNILDGVTLTAANINDAALKSAANTFTAGQIISATVPSLRISESDAAANNQRWYAYAQGEAFFLSAATDADVHTNYMTVQRTAGTVDSIALAATSITLNGVSASDFARLSQNNTFTGSSDGSRAFSIANTSTNAAAYQNLNVSNASNSVVLNITGTGWSGTFLTGGDTGEAGHLYTTTTIPLELGTNNTLRLQISGSGNFDFKAGTMTTTGAVTFATVANSTSTTLAAGQLHFITGNATLPNLTAGQWIQVINDSASPITISKNASDTTYWATTGATVSTSFTLAARGVLTARCNPAGSAVYVSGAGITGAT